MTMPGIPLEPFRVTCDDCGAQGWTYDFQHAGRAVECSCCPLGHDHDEAAACPRAHEGPCGKGVPGCNVCRPVTVWGKAHLRLIDLADLMDVAAEPDALPNQPDPAARPA